MSNLQAELAIFGVMVFLVATSFYAKDTDAKDAPRMLLSERVLEYLADHELRTVEQMAVHLGADAEELSAVLADLHERHLILRSEFGPQSARFAVYWVPKFTVKVA